MFEDTTPVFTHTLRHSVEDLSPFTRVSDQFEYRRDLILKMFEEYKVPFEFDVIVSRGGLLKPIEGGVYRINDQMISELETP
ncbi:MAG: butyrate kinase, partial [Muribaculaceae bacterium]|nr:butyrate kinase [Muribaculaceae bacterium]